MNDTHLPKPSVPYSGPKLLPEVPEPAFFKTLPSSGDEAFDLAIRIVFHHEGYYSNDPDDPGGPTAWGWSLRTAQKAGDLDGDGIPDFDIDRDGDIDIDDIRQLSARQAVDRYYLHWWKKNGYCRLPFWLSAKVFDLAVVMGASQANKLLQRAIRAVSGESLVEDGILGPVTRKAIMECGHTSLIIALRSEAAGFFRLLAAKRPSSQKYLRGWLNRAYF